MGKIFTIKKSNILAQTVLKEILNIHVICTKVYLCFTIVKGISILSAVVPLCCFKTIILLDRCACFKISALALKSKENE